jgi:hypothetical protein
VTAPAHRIPQPGTCGEIGPPPIPGGRGYACTLKAGHPGTILAAKIGTFRGHLARDDGRVLDTWVTRT